MVFRSYSLLRPILVVGLLLAAAGCVAPWQAQPAGGSALLPAPSRPTALPGPADRGTGLDPKARDIERHLGFQ